MNDPAIELIKWHLENHPNTQNMTLAKMIYGQNRLWFKDVEEVRSAIRYYRGAGGKKKLATAPDTFLSKEKIAEKYSLPESIETEYKPFKIVGNRGLIFNDVHVPFHSPAALRTMFDFTKNENLDFVLINGDFMDCFDVSSFTHDPTLVSMRDERDMAKGMLAEIRRVYPNAKIFYKFGNHESRLEQYLMRKAPELFGMSEFRLEVLLDLYNSGIEYIPEDIYVEINGQLAVFHGHEYKNGITSPANPARTAYLRAKDCAIVGHYHQSSEHTEPSINGKVVTCWSTGCLCGLHPKYMPLNRWNQGFALYTRNENGFWHVKNKRIIGTEVV